MHTQVLGALTWWVPTSSPAPGGGSLISNAPDHSPLLCPLPSAWTTLPSQSPHDLLSAPWTHPFPYFSHSSIGAHLLLHHHFCQTSVQTALPPWTGIFCSWLHFRVPASSPPAIGCSLGARAGRCLPHTRR